MWKSEDDNRIKFRGKRVDNGEWVYGSPLRMCYGSEERLYIAKNPCNVWHFKFTKADEEYESGVFEVIPSSVGQFTGFTDCEGKEIYEGDVNTNGGVLEFSNGAWWFRYKDNSGAMLNDYTHTLTKIIGNIHDKQEAGK